MELICEKDCRTCRKENCLMRRCPPAMVIGTPDRPILKEESPKPNFDWTEGPKANLVE